MARASETHAFKPDPITAERLAQSSKTLKPTELGTMFSGSFGSLPADRAKLVWECTIDAAPPATIRPKKPKLWLTCKCDLEPKVVYRLS